MRRVKSVMLALEREDVYRGALMLVNRAAPLRLPTPEASLAELAPGVLLERQAALLLQKALEASGAAGRVLPISGYRSGAQQQKIYDDSLREHGPEHTAAYVALPGCSEHQAGLAVDLAHAAESSDIVTPGFPQMGACLRFAQAAPRYGFVERYPKGKEHVTGIGYEPWHFRYLGAPHAQLMAERGLVLEEYHEWLRAFPFHQRPLHCDAHGRGFRIGYVAAQRGQTEIELSGEPYTLSGNNVDGFIVTVWEGCL